MANFNNSIIAGNLVRDPELRRTDEGLTITRMTLAVARFTASGSVTDYVPIKAFGKLADAAGTYLCAGSGVLVAGTLHSSTYEKNGEKRYGLELVARELQFLDKRDGVARVAADDDEAHAEVA